MVSIGAALTLDWGGLLRLLYPQSPRSRCTNGRCCLPPWQPLDKFSLCIKVLHVPEVARGHAYQPGLRQAFALGLIAPRYPGATIP